MFRPVTLTKKVPVRAGEAEGTAAATEAGAAVERETETAAMRAIDEDEGDDQGQSSDGVVDMDASVIDAASSAVA